MLADKLEILVHKKPDIHVIDDLLGNSFLVDIMVRQDLYMEYEHCFGSLGSVQNDAWESLANFSQDKIYIKMVLKYYI